MAPSQAPGAAQGRGSASDTKPLPGGIDEGRIADLDLDLAVADGVDRAHPLSDPLGAAAQAAAPAGGGDPQQVAHMQQLIGNVAFTEGATHAFLTGAGMIWLGTLIVLLFLNVKHEELAVDEIPEGVAAH